MGKYKEPNKVCLYLPLIQKFPVSDGAEVMIWKHRLYILESRHV